MKIWTTDDRSRGRIRWFGSCACILCAMAMVGRLTTTDAADTPQARQWVAISDRVLADLTGAGKQIGYPGGTAGIAVDPATGDIFMVVPDHGLWRSNDQGVGFTRVDGGKIGGRCETGFALQFDPAGRRLACFMIYGSCASTPDAGEKWRPWSTQHLDFGAVDWEGTGNAMLALRHESGGVLCMTTDGGTTWRDLGRKGPDGKPVADDRQYTALGMFDANTLTASKGQGILRSADAGVTWTKVADAKLAAPVMQVRRGVGYWMTDKGVLVSRDQGQSWRLEMQVDAVFGPWFGGEDSQVVVVGKKGFLESRDGGKAWNHVADLPPGYSVGHVGPNYAWDVKRDIFYASSMGKPAYRFSRQAKP